jgi:hypothetical protein
MDLVISFDTEDYATPEALDAKGWWASELTARGLRGSFQVVGEVVRKLRREGRRDVLDALAKHEIGTHSDYHSVHPTHAEALEGKGLAEGVAWVLETEAPCLEVLLNEFHRVPVSYCKPGASWGPATVLAHAAAGVKVFADSPFHEAAGRPFWYAGMLMCHYDMAFESFFGEAESENARFKAEFEKRAERFGEDGLFVLYTHPNMLVTSTFWDVAYFDGRQVPPRECPPAPLRSPKEIQTAKDRVRRWLDWIKTKKNVRNVDFATVYAERAPGRRGLAELLDECGLKPGEEGRLPLREPVGKAFLKAEAFAKLGYHWGVFPKAFTGRALLEQARLLAWTAAPAKKRVAKKARASARRKGGRK